MRSIGKSVLIRNTWLGSPSLKCTSRGMLGKLHTLSTSRSSSQTGTNNTALRDVETTEWCDHCESEWVTLLLRSLQAKARVLPMPWKAQHDLPTVYPVPFRMCLHCLLPPFPLWHPSSDSLPYCLSKTPRRLPHQGLTPAVPSACKPFPLTSWRPTSHLLQAFTHTSPSLTTQFKTATPLPSMS